MVAKKTTRTLGYILLALVMVGLVGFGSTNFGSSGHSIGSVGNTEIDSGRYFRELNAELRAFQAATGQNLPFAQAQAFGIDQQVLARVIAATAIDNEAARMGLSVGDATVRDQVLLYRDFQGPGGSFDPEQYRFILGQQGLTPAEFETTLRTDLARGLMQAAVTRGVASPRVYAETLFAYAREARDFTWGSLSLGALEAQPGAPDEAALNALYEANPGEYTLPETRHATYVWLRPEALIDQVEVDEADLRALYDERQSEFMQPERRLVERLVFGTEQDAQAAADALTAGTTDFETLVSERGLTLADIDLGDVTREALGNAGDAVFALSEPGAVAGPVETALGPALIRMNAILAAHEVSFDAVRDELVAQFAGDAARRMVEADIAPLDDALAGGATLEELADENPEIALATIDWQAGEQAGIAAYDEFRTAIADGATGDFPELIRLEDGGVFALRLDAIDPPRLQTLDEVRGRVVADWSAAERMRLLGEQARAMLPVLESGSESLASLGLTEVSETGLTRDAVIDGTPPELLSEVFAMTPGAWQVLDGDGEVVLVRLDAVHAADPTRAQDQPVIAAFAERTAQEVALDVQGAFANALQQQAGISLNQAVINAIHAQFP